ncbi:C-C motif chemokine 4-like isoform X1 [Gopherus flavomarginatus]|uniref:C-C motif chemokine 4-like isoform X1 n=1 Tax=Gopherus flavomarginatus TaxID=286002 RepID=UPI0021CC1E68|nr:C-C motif chemokine 4-like isoform X1 [Gopherus flavomarginatus]
MGKWTLLDFYELQLVHRTRLIADTGIRSPGGSAVPEKCCFRFQKTKLKRDNTISCYPTSPVCPQPAVIFKMKEGQEICAKPDRPWVKEYQKFLSSASKA